MKGETHKDTQHQTGHHLSRTLLRHAGGVTAARERQEVRDGRKDPLYAPPALLHRMVNAGMLGRKSGRGFYQ